MAHRKLEFPMPAPAAVVFDAFHYHHWKHQWDSLVSDTVVESDAPCPSIGATSTNKGRGLLAPLAMTTKFVSYEPPLIAAATMVGKSFPFDRWAASMRHVDKGDGGSTLVYTYTLEVPPSPYRWLLEPIVDLIFLRATRKRFARLSKFLKSNTADVLAWQKTVKAPNNLQAPSTGVEPAQEVQESK